MSLVFVNALQGQFVNYPYTKWAAGGLPPRLEWLERGAPATMEAYAAIP